MLTSRDISRDNRELVSHVSETVGASFIRDTLHLSETENNVEGSVVTYNLRGEQKIFLVRNSPVSAYLSRNLEFDFWVLPKTC
jgi:hypothetical protein